MRLIVDADWILFNASYVKQDEEPKSFNECMDSIDYYIDSLFEETSAEEYVLCFTSGGNNYRKLVDPEYKANRKGKELPAFFNEMKTYIFEKYNCAYGLSLEADDFCACYLKKYPDAIVSHVDKDLNQIVGSHYDSKKKEFYDITSEEANRLLWTQMITGDPGDNIKGIPGKGIKFAEKLFDVESIEVGQVTHRQLVLEAYINQFGEYEGVQEFYKNYMCLKLLDTGVTLPELKNID